MVVPDKVVVGFFSAVVLAMATVAGLLWGEIKDLTAEKKVLIERLMKCKEQ